MNGGKGRVAAATMVLTKAMEPTNDRLTALKYAMKMHDNDEMRYAIAEKLSELGYIDWADLCRGSPALEHIAEIESVLGL
jgi:hypothetical protein